MAGQPLRAEDDELTDGEDGPSAFVPGIVLNLLPLLLLGVPLTLNQFAGGAPFAIPMAMNVAAGILAGEKGEKRARWFCTLAVPGNILLILATLMVEDTFHDRTVKLLWLSVTAGAAATLWQTVTCWRKYRREKAKTNPPGRLSKWLKRIALTLLVLCCMLAAAIYFSDPLDFCTCKDGKYVARAPQRETTALKNTYVSLLTMPSGIAAALPEDRSAETLRLLDFSLPGDAGYHPQDAHAVFPMVKDNRMASDVYVPLHDLRLLTGSDDPRLIFNLRRHKNKETDGLTVALFAIIPDAKFCDGTIGYKAGRKFVIAKDNHRLADDPDDFVWPEENHEATCVQTGDGRNYYFQILIIPKIKP